MPDDALAPPARPDAAWLLTALCDAIDTHVWDDLAPLLADDFTCTYAHTGEAFDRDGWVHLNATYPGFERLVVEEIVGDGDRAAARCRVTARGDDGVTAYAVATFVTASGDRITRMTEVWTDVDQPTPDRGAR